MCAKIREGFVSNSSSSSFILPVNSVDDEIVIKIKISDLQKMFEDCGETSIRSIIKTKEDLIEYMYDYIGFSKRGKTEEEFLTELDEEGMLNTYNDMLKLINDGKHIITGNISYHDGGLKAILLKMNAEINN